MRYAYAILALLFFASPAGASLTPTADATFDPSPEISSWFQDVMKMRDANPPFYLWKSGGARPISIKDIQRVLRRR